MSPCTTPFFTSFDVIVWGKLRADNVRTHHTGIPNHLSLLRFDGDLSYMGLPTNHKLSRAKILRGFELHSRQSCPSIERMRTTESISCSSTALVTFHPTSMFDGKREIFCPQSRSSDLPEIMKRPSACRNLDYLVRSTYILNLRQSRRKSSAAYFAE